MAETPLEGTMRSRPNEPWAVSRQIQEVDGKWFWRLLGRKPPRGWKAPVLAESGIGYDTRDEAERALLWLIGHRIPGEDAPDPVHVLAYSTTDELLHELTRRIEAAGIDRALGVELTDGAGA